MPGGVRREALTKDTDKRQAEEQQEVQRSQAARDDFRKNEKEAHWALRRLGQRPFRRHSLLDDMLKEKSENS